MKYYLVLLLVFTATTAFCQQVPDFTKIPLNQASDYKAAEPSVLQAAGYVFSTPYQKEDQTRLNCYQFILKWMTGTPDYTFTFDEPATKAFKGDTDLLGQYVAAMAKFGIENPASSKEVKTVELHAMTSVLTYCNNPANNLKMTKQMKKLWEASEKGQLAEVLQ